MCYAFSIRDNHGPKLMALRLWCKQPRKGTKEGVDLMASYHLKNERAGPQGFPSLEDLESGKLVGAIIPMSEHAKVALRDSIELIEYLMNQDNVTWS